MQGVVPRGGDHMINPTGTQSKQAKKRARQASERMPDQKNREKTKTIMPNHSQYLRQARDTYLVMPSFYYYPNQGIWKPPGLQQHFMPDHRYVLQATVDVPSARSAATRNEARMDYLSAARREEDQSVRSMVTQIIQNMITGPVPAPVPVPAPAPVRAPVLAPVTQQPGSAAQQTLPHVPTPGHPLSPASVAPATWQTTPMANGWVTSSANADVASVPSKECEEWFRDEKSRLTWERTFATRNFRNVDWRKSLRWISSCCPVADPNRLTSGGHMSDATGEVGGNPMERTDHAIWAKHLGEVADWFVAIASEIKQMATPLGARFADYMWTELMARYKFVRDGKCKRTAYCVAHNASYEWIWNKYADIIKPFCKQFKKFSETYTSRNSIGNMCETAAFKMWCAGHDVALWRWIDLVQAEFLS